MAWIWPTAIAAAITFLYLFHQWRNLSNKKKKLPPSPKGFPIIGHFHLLNKNPHQNLHLLVHKHGPIMYTRFGSIPTIIVSSLSTAELFLKTHDLTFADRPHHEATYYLSYQQRNIVFCRNGDYWCNMSKLCTLQLLSNQRIVQFEPMRKAKLGIMVASFRAVDVSARIMAINADMTYLMVFGRKFEGRELDERGFKEVMACWLVD